MRHVVTLLALVASVVVEAPLAAANGQAPDASAHATIQSVAQGATNSIRGSSGDGGQDLAHAVGPLQESQREGDLLMIGDLHHAPENAPQDMVPVHVEIEIPAETIEPYR